MYRPSLAVFEDFLEKATDRLDSGIPLISLKFEQQQEDVPSRGVQEYKSIRVSLESIHIHLLGLVS